MIDLKKYELFREFSDEMLAELSSVSSIADYEQGSSVFSEGEAGEALYILDEGEVAIRRYTDRSRSRQKQIAAIEKGDFFGEMAIFDSKPRSASAYCETPCRVIEIRKEDLMRIIRKEPEIAISQFMALNRVLSERLRMTNQNFITTFEIGQIMATVKKMGELFDLTLEHLLSAIEKADAAFFALYDEFNESFTLISRKGPAAEKINEQELTKDDSIVRELVKTGEPIYIDNTDESRKFPDLVQKTYDGKSLLAAPVLRAGRLTGIFFVVSFTEYGAFNQANRLLVGTVARQIAPAIEDLKHQEEEENRKRLQEKRYSY